MISIHTLYYLSPSSSYINLLTNIGCDSFYFMLKCNEDSCSDSEAEELCLERSLVVESAIEVDHLICSICHHIVWQPQACGSQHGCHNAFCGTCIQSWLQRCRDQQDQSDPLCPQCKRPFISSRIPPILNCVLESLHLRCPNWASGCQTIIPYNQIEKHYLACQFKMRRCRGCRSEVLALNYDQHINECPKYIIECGYCGANLPKIEYLNGHVTRKDNTTERGFDCFEHEIETIGERVEDLKEDIEQMKERCSQAEELTRTLLIGKPLNLRISYFTTFTSHFSFPQPKLIKASWNEQKDKFDFLHFYIINPIFTDSFVSIQWSIHVKQMSGNILLGFCSNMNINSLDYIVNKYGELKRKDVHLSKYHIVRKNDFSFSQGDIIRCRFQSLQKCIKLQNQTKKQQLQLGPSEVEEFSEGQKIYVFISMDTLNDCISFL